MRKIGYELDQQSGSHIILRQSASPHRRLVVPDYKEIARGALRANIHQSGLTVDEFIALL